MEKSDTMIFLTEGDSAAGSLEVSRDVNTQAIFALRGKPKNSYGEEYQEILKNEELNFLIQALAAPSWSLLLRVSEITFLK